LAQQVLIQSLEEPQLLQALLEEVEEQEKVKEEIAKNSINFQGTMSACLQMPHMIKTMQKLTGYTAKWTLD
jgi:t-SNARE complex subunit (syntaxin)